MKCVGDIDYARASKGAMIEKIDQTEIPVAGLDEMIQLKEGVRDIDKRDYLFLKGKKEYLSKKS